MNADDILMVALMYIQPNRLTGDHAYITTDDILGSLRSDYFKQVFKSWDYEQAKDFARQAYKAHKPSADGACVVAVKDAGKGFSQRVFIVSDDIYGEERDFENDPLVGPERIQPEMITKSWREKYNVAFKLNVERFLSDKGWLDVVLEKGKTATAIRKSLTRKKSK